jgi:hypothetical protein
MLGFHVRHLRWVPHRLSDSYKSRCVELPEELFSVLDSQNPRVGHDIVTLNESWDCFRADWELIWLRRGEEVFERE